MLKRPNVILIVADDMGYGDFGIFNAGPAALLTGRYSHRTGALTPIEVNKHGKSPVHARLIERV